MNERQTKIVAFLDKEKDWVKGKDLALIMHVSTRTIRSDIETINSQIKDGWIESSYQQGYRLHLEASSNSLINKEEIPQNSKERCNYILKKLLSVKECSMTDLSDQVCASIYTVEQDLKAIRGMLREDSELDLVYRKGQVSLNGDEYDKRRLFKRLLMEEVEENFFNLDCIARLYPEFDLYRCKEILSSCMESHGYSIREMEIPMILMHIGVALKRMMQFNLIEDRPCEPRLEQTVEYKVAQDLYERISHLYPIKVNNDEIEQVALLLLGKRAMEYTDNIIEINGWVYDLNDITIQMLNSIYHHFGVNMTEDEDLIRGLSLHLRSLSDRLNHDTSIKNFYLEEIRWRFPLIFDMAVCAGDKLRAITGLKISQDELGFLALHFGASYNRATAAKRYRALLFFPNDQALSNLVVSKIRTQFEDRMNIIGIEKTFEEQKVKKLNPDLILTTIPLGHSMDIPTIELSIFYTPENEAAIFSCLNRLDKEKGHAEFLSKIKNLIRPEYFYENFKAESVEGVLKSMADPLINAGIAPENYAQSVLEREQFAPTSFVMGFALPHALDCDVAESIISIAFLDHPIHWGAFDVEFVILLAIRPSDHELLRVFFDWWISIVSNQIRFNRLKRQKNYKAFMSILLEE